jgi:hypothetical protein
LRARTPRNDSTESASYRPESRNRLRRQSRLPEKGRNLSERAGWSRGGSRPPRRSSKRSHLMNRPSLQQLICNHPVAESSFPNGAKPLKTNSRNFIPQRDMTRYYNGTRDCSCNSTTVRPALGWPISHHSVRARFCCQSRLPLKGG